MASPGISRMLGFCCFIYLAVTICSTGQTKARRHTRFHDVKEMDILSVAYEDQYNDYTSSTELSDYINDEGSGIYDFELREEETSDGVPKSKLGAARSNASSKNWYEDIENPGFKKTKFSNKIEHEDSDFTLVSENSYSTLVPPPQTEVTTTEQKQTRESSTPNVPASPSEVSTKTKPASITTSFQTSKATETTASTSEDYTCNPNDCEKIEIEIIPSRQSLLPGGNFSLLCNVHANISELVLYEWFLADEDRLLKITDETKKKLVQEAKLSNGGKYVCVVAYDNHGCCKSSAISVVVIYEKPAYWIHIAVLLGISLGLLLLVCVPFTLKLQRKYRQMGAYKERNAQDKQPLTI